MLITSRGQLFIRPIAANNGKFILRIEDTDRKRLVADSVTKLMETLSWLKLTPDEGPDLAGDVGPYFQSQRLHIYKKEADRLVDQGWLYWTSADLDRIKRISDQIIITIYL